MIRTYVDRWGKYNYVKIAERLLGNDWKRAERNRDYLTYDEMKRYKLVLKTLGELEKEELRALAIRYYKPNKFRSYGAIVPTPYPEITKTLGVSRQRCDTMIYYALKRFGEIAIKYAEEEEGGNGDESE